MTRVQVGAKEEGDRRGGFVLDRIRGSVAELLGAAPGELAADANLLDQGLDSISIMRLANKFRRDGATATFADLVANPNLADWARLLSAVDLAAGPVEAPVRFEEGQPFSLGPMQQAFLLGATQGAADEAVNAHYYLELDGERLDPTRLERAMFALLRRHPMLRAKFSADFRQQVLAASPWRGLSCHDLRDASASAAEAHLAELRARLSHRRLQVSEGEVIDLQLTLLPGGRGRLHLNVEMLVCDANSFQILMTDLAQLYRSEQALPPLAYSFERYRSDLEASRGEADKAAERYWRDKVASMPRRPALPLAAQTYKAHESRVSRKCHRVSPQAYLRLREACRRQGVTPPLAMATAFAEVLGLWSAEKTFLLNMPVFGREDVHPGVAQVVGDFSNLLILAVDLSEDLGFADQARRLQDHFRRDISHAGYSGLEVLRALARRDPSDWFVAPIVFTSALGLGDLFGEDVRDVFGEPIWISSQTPQVWLDYQLIEDAGGLLINWDVTEAVFAPGVPDAMFKAYCGLVDRLLCDDSDWEAPVRIEPGNAVRRPPALAGAAERLLHDDFFARAQAEPDRPALLWGEAQQLSYDALASQALSIAACLIDAGAGAGDPIAISLPRGPLQAAAALGVLAAGAAYVPVSPAQPEHRRRQIYRDAGVRLVLTQSHAADPIDLDLKVEVIDVAQAIAREQGLSQPAAVAADQLAYVIYTSGSTGAPKGVEISHRSAMNTIDDINRRFDVCERDRVVAVSAFDFDLSVYDLFGLLSVGGAAILVDESSAKEAAVWVQLARRWDATIWNSVPALCDMFVVAATAAGASPPLRLALVSGDWIGLDLPDRFRQLCPASRFIGLGGATEASIWSNAFEVDRVDCGWPSIPYGWPLTNQTYRVVDDRGRDCPVWAPGELWIGGAGLARGYRNDPQRTRAQFVEDSGGRWYRTGDVGRFHPEGLLEFLGRCDTQVKVNGFRIELGEVEAALTAHPAVDAAVAFVVETPTRSLAAVVHADPAVVDARELRRFIAGRLPASMIPETVQVREAKLPLTANGKLDRRVAHTLLGPIAPVPDDWSPPREGMEAALAAEWTDLLAPPGPIGRNQSFFKIGGDSLLATKLLAKVKDRYGVEVRLQELLKAPQLADLSDLVESRAAKLEEGEI